MNHLTKLAALSWPIVFGIGLGVGILFFALAYDDGSAITTQLVTSQTELTKERANLDKTKKTAEDLKKFKEEMVRIDKKRASLLSYLPISITEYDFYSTLDSQAKQAGASDISIEPAGQDEKRDFYGQKKLSMKFVGQYSQIVQFLANLTSVHRLITVERMKLTILSGSEPDAPKIKFEGILNTFYFVNSEQSQDKEKGKANSGT